MINKIRVTNRYAKIQLMLQDVQSEKVQSRKFLVIIVYFILLYFIYVDSRSMLIISWKWFLINPSTLSPLPPSMIDWSNSFHRTEETNDSCSTRSNWKRNCFPGIYQLGDGIPLREQIGFPFKRTSIKDRKGWRGLWVLFKPMDPLRDADKSRHGVQVRTLHTTHTQFSVWPGWKTPPVEPRARIRHVLG